MRPLLSICIPTYNRATLLRQAIKDLMPQLERLEGAANVVVSDNCSEDDTPAVLASFASPLLAQRRNECNVGIVQNLRRVVTAATGEYVWVLGDDDRVHPSAVDTVVSRLKENADIGVLFLNCVVCEESKYAGETTYATTRPFCVDLTTRRVPRWEDVLLTSEKPGLGTSIVHHVFRREAWLAASRCVFDKVGESTSMFTCLEDTLIAPLIVAQQAVGKPALYVGTPVVCVLVGQQEWFPRWPSLLLEFGLQLADAFEALGARAEVVKHYRLCILKSEETVWRRILDPRRPSATVARSWIDLTGIIRREGGNGELWDSIAECAGLFRPSNRWAWAGVLCGGWRHRGFWLTFLPRVARGGARWILCSPMALVTRVMATCRRGVERTLRPNRAVTHDPADYAEMLQALDADASAAFAGLAECAGKVRVRHPVYVVNGSRFRIGTGFSAGPGCRFEAWTHYGGRDHDPHVTIGNGVSFGFWCHVGAVDRIEIGNRVLVGSGVLITDHAHEPPPADAPSRDPRAGGLSSKGPVVIEDDVWIGEHACVLAGVQVGRGAVLGANSVVTRDVPPFTKVGGVPARVLGSTRSMQGREASPCNSEREAAS
ncbi:MAG: glycosyltransferase [Lentisphaerae bacterium]|nr:glycosyltransferase [Lentisphaerota bacterium]